MSEPCESFLYSVLFFMNLLLLGLFLFFFSTFIFVLYFTFLGFKPLLFYSLNLIFTLIDMN